MLKKIGLSIFIMLVIASSCKKARKKVIDAVVEIKDKIIKGYWSDYEGLTIEVKDTDAFVVDFSTSNIGSNPTVFNPSMPYIKNIVRTGSDSWTGDVIKGTYSFNVLTSVTYEPTGIKVATDATGKDIFTLSNGDPNSINWAIKDPGYVPPSDPYTPQSNGCDTVSSLSNTGNMASLTNWVGSNRFFTDVPIRSAIFLPSFMQAGYCNYKMSGNLNYADPGIAGVSPQRISLILILNHKPTTNETLTLRTYSGYAEEGEAQILLDGGYESQTNGGVIDISVSGGKITATANNITLNGSCVINFVLVGE